jgi:hypothetical protein
MLITNCEKFARDICQAHEDLKLCRHLPADGWGNITGPLINYQPKEKIELWKTEE